MISFSERFIKRHLSSFIIDLNDLRMSTLKLVLVPRPAADGDSYGFALSVCGESHIGFLEETCIGLGGPHVHAV